MAGYRFCRPSDFSTRTDWTARVRFSYAHVAAAPGGGDMFVQLFVPGYTRADLDERRTGKAMVRGTFAPDGHPTSVQVSSSSGDAILDRKSLDAMASIQLVFRPGTKLTRPLVFEQPFIYEIR